MLRLCDVTRWNCHVLAGTFECSNVMTFFDLLTLLNRRRDQFCIRGSVCYAFKYEWWCLVKNYKTSEFFVWCGVLRFDVTFHKSVPKWVERNWKCFSVYGQTFWTSCPLLWRKIFISTLFLFINIYEHPLNASVCQTIILWSISLCASVP